MGKRKIFIFDDNVEILELCTEILEDLNCEVRTSPTTTDVEKQVENYMPDLIFMDNWLPEISGVEATQILKANKNLQAIPVIYFSANTDIRELSEIAGADDYLEKPFDLNLFEDLVQKWLKK